MVLGDEAGFNEETGSNNIIISNEGVGTDEGTIRIGTEGKQTRAFLAGIQSTSISGCTVQVTVEGQLGCNPAAGATGATGATGAKGATGATGKEGAKGATGATGATGSTGASGPAGNAAVATFASFQNVPSGNCLNYTMLAGQGNGSCPTKTSGFSSSALLAGMPANGGKVSNLYAETNATLSGKEEATVAVIDNTTGVTLLSCTVNSTSKGKCSNTATASVAAAAGDRLEVKVTATGSNCNNKQWQVRFRY